MKVLTGYARENRKTPTKAELEFKKDLQRRGIKFRSQRPVDVYIVDFILPDYKAIAEIDGGYHLTDDQQAKDKIRQEYLESLGFTVFRLTNEQVYNKDYETFLNWLDSLELTDNKHWWKIYGQPKY